MILILKDKQTLEDELEKGHQIDGLECQIDKEYVIQDCNIEWHVFKLKDSPLIYIKKSIGNLTDHFVFCKPDGLNFGSKQDWLDQGHDWLFSDHNYSESIFQNGDEYKILGEPFVCQAETGINEWSNALVVEWATNVDTLNPRLIVIKIKNYIEFYQGCQISENEVEFL